LLDCATKKMSFVGTHTNVRKKKLFFLKKIYIFITVIIN
jgi:hypothetical protein